MDKGPSVPKKTLSRSTTYLYASPAPLIAMLGCWRIRGQVTVPKKTLLFVLILAISQHCNQGCGGWLSRGKLLRTFARSVIFGTDGKRCGVTMIICFHRAMFCFYPICFNAVVSSTPRPTSVAAITRSAQTRDEVMLVALRL